MHKELKKEFEKHFLDYVLLIIAGVFTVVCLYMFKGNRGMQMALVVGYAIFYVAWAMYHHLLNSSMRLKNMLEYILIASIIVLTIKIIVSP